MSSGWLIEIVVLAMIAGFVALRLVSVLGRRTGHEQQPVSHPLDRSGASSASHSGANHGDQSQQNNLIGNPNLDPNAVEGVRSILSADPSFNVDSFAQGARAAYGMVLEAFWTGDTEALDNLAADDVAQDFAAAIADRNEQGLTLENKLVRIDNAIITDASLSSMMAHITVRFDADLVAITRNSSGEIIAGSVSDAVSTHDIWTFSRHLGSPDPNWLLVSTDEATQ